MNSKRIAATAAASFAGLLLAQQPSEPAKGNPLSNEIKDMYTYSKNNILKAADRMPEEHYSFKPADTVRTYGQMVAHIADAQYLLCAPARGVERPPVQVEKTMTTKADIVAALKEAFAFCDVPYDALTDAKLADPVTMFGQTRTRLGALAANAGHNWEHYGNLITYLRIKGLTPPSSDPRPPKKK